MNHSFNTEIAEKYGVSEAILIENIYFWVSKNKANEKHFHDGQYWTYNSTKAFAELFPYWSESQIERIIKSLVVQKVILIGNYNQIKFDRTRWIALSAGVSSIYRNHKMGSTKSQDGLNEIEEPIPDINTNINTDTVAAKATVDKGIEFERFWKLYPNKQKKPYALKIWNKVKPLEYDKIFDVLPKFINSEQWTKQKGTFIPHPATWLNNQCWNDDIPADYEKPYEAKLDCSGGGMQM